MTTENEEVRNWDDPPVFGETKVPIAAMLDSFIEGLSLDEFLEKNPTVTRVQTVQVLEYLKSTIHNVRK